MTVQRSQIANANSIIAKAFAFSERLEVVLVAIAAGVKELTANAVASVIIESSVLLTTIALLII